MIVQPQNISNSGAGTGWSNYVLGKNKDRDEARLIVGDTNLGDTICNNRDYVRFVISFSKEDDVSPEQGRLIAKEWFDEFMTGFDKDEYHLDLVEHQDTDILHYHARIPKVNILTNTVLTPYYHKADLNYIKAVNEYIAEKHNLTLGTDKKVITQDPTKAEGRIKKWREEHGQKPFDFSKKKERDTARVSLNNFVKDLVTSEVVNDLEGIKSALNGNGYPVVNQGFEQDTKQHYLTIQDQNGKKMKLKGEIFNPEFHQNNLEEKISAICDKGAVKLERRSKEVIEKNLAKYREKREKWIEKQYGSARAKARKEIEEREAKILSVSKTKIKEINERKPDDTYIKRARRRVANVQNRRRNRGRTRARGLLVENYNFPKRKDYRAIEEATQERYNRGEIGEHLNRLVYKIGNKFEQSNAISRRRNRREEDRKVGRGIVQTTAKPSKKKRKPKRLRP